MIHTGVLQVQSKSTVTTHTVASDGALVVDGKFTFHQSYKWNASIVRVSVSQVALAGINSQLPSVEALSCWVLLRRCRSSNPF